MSTGKKRWCKIFAATLAVACICAWHLLRFPSPPFIAFLYVGQGDATVLFTGDTRMLVDCGPDAAVLAQLHTLFKPWDKRLDYLVVTHPDLDHVGGCIDVLLAFDVRQVIFNGVHPANNVHWDEFVQAAAQEKAQLITGSAGMHLALNNGSIVFLYPDAQLDNAAALEDNDASLVMSITYGATHILLTGDASVAVEHKLIERYGETIKSNILKVGHHGSKTSTSREWLRTTAPDLAIISSGKDNRFGHPHARVLYNLGTEHILFRRMDTEGTIRIPL